MINDIRLLTNVHFDRCPIVDNRVLQAALSTRRSLEIHCIGTKVNPHEFIGKHSDTVVHLKADTANINKYACQNITFFV